MDPNMYSNYYYGIKGFDSLIFGRKEIHGASITQTKLVPLVEHLK
jgi:hypothetical protein